jgi:hypothetical protein
MKIPRAQGEEGKARGILYVPLVSADPLRPLLPHGDPFHEPGQVGPGGDAQGRLERSARPPAVSRVLVAKPEDVPGPFGQQVAAAGRDLPQLSHRRRRRPAVPGSRSGKHVLARPAPPGLIVPSLPVTVIVPDSLIRLVLPAVSTVPISRIVPLVAERAAPFGRLPRAEVA